MTNPIAGFTTIFKYAAGTVIGKLTSIGGFKFKSEVIDITSHQSSSGWREFIAGLKDGGEIPLEGHFIQDDAGQLALFGHLGGAVQSFVVVFPDLSQWAFDGIVTGVECGKGDLKDQIPFAATVKLTGIPVFTGVTTLRTVTFTVTAAAGGADIEGATVLFNNETKLTDSSGEAVFTNVADATYYYAVGKTLYTPQSSTVVVNGTEAVAISLVLA